MIVRIRGVAEFDVEVHDIVSEEGDGAGKLAEQWLDVALRSPYYRQLGGDGTVTLASFRPESSRVL